MKAGKVREFELVEGVKMKFCWCPATTSGQWKKISGGKDSFQMGSPEGADPCDDDEPVHAVTLTKGFWIGQYEVTQAQWEGVMGTGTNPSDFKSPDRPVDSVSWEGCTNFIARVNAAGKIRVSLPTEAQWEYACRAGTTTSLPSGRDLVFKGRIDGPELDGIAWYGGNSSVGFDLDNGWDCSGWMEMQHPGTRAGTHPVGKKTPNRWQIYDMIGNVWEWCEDWYGAYEGDCTDPTGPTSGRYRVIRGGSWYYYAYGCRSADRGRLNPSSWPSSIFGFRLCCSAGPHAE